MVIVRGANSGDIRSVMGIHNEAFPGFFLTKLGGGFLEELYRGYLEISGGILLVATIEEDVVGFAAGSASPSDFYSLLKRQRGIYFLVKALPSLIRSPYAVLVKLIYALFYRGDAPEALGNAALLSSIGVAPGMLGEGVGIELLQSFELVASSSGASSVYLTTDALSNERAQAFYRKCGYSEEKRFTHFAGREMIRFVKVIGRS